MNAPDNPFTIIHDFFNKDMEDPPSCFDLFSTLEGDLLGDQLFELNTFVTKGSLFSIPFIEFTNRMRQMISSGEYRAMIPPEQLGEEGEKILDCLEMFLRFEDDEEEKSSIESLFGKEEIPRLLATLTFSAYTYLESYSRNIVKRLMENEIVSSEMIERIKKYQDGLPKRNHPKPIDEISDLLGPGLERRLQNIVIGLNLEPLLQREFGEKYTFYLNLFRYFIKLRNSLAHSDPAPPFEEYQHSYLESNLEEFRKEFMTISKDLELTPFKKLQEPIERWIQEMFEPLALMGSVGEMASVYPAMIDAGISKLLQM